MVIVWIVLAVALLAVELHHLAFFAMFGAAGSLAAAVVALIAPSLVVVQIFAIGVAAAGVVLVRPYVSQAFEFRGPGGRIGGVHGGLFAARGVSIDEIGGHQAGHVRLLGESWLAVSWDDEPIPPTTPVIVMGVNGTTLTVRAAEFKELP